MSKRCEKCPKWEKRDPQGTHTQTFNGVTHTHPACAKAALAQK